MGDCVALKTIEDRAQSPREHSRVSPGLVVLLNTSKCIGLRRCTELVSRVMSGDWSGRARGGYGPPFFATSQVQS
jgi:hypothetical protein